MYIFESSAMRVLIPSYLNKDYRQSLRYELCEILYSDYKSRTFFLDRMLEQKKTVLEKLTNFVETNPELKNHKNSTSYWYPFPGVSNTDNLRLYNDFYPNDNGEITYFCKEGENSWEYSDYLSDPVKIQLTLMCNDLNTMMVDNKTAKEIVEINDQIFNITLSVVGDTLNYAGQNNSEYIKNYMSKNKENEDGIKSNVQYDADFKDMLLRSIHRFNENTKYLESAIVNCERASLQEAIMPQSSSDRDRERKIKI